MDPIAVSDLRGFLEGAWRLTRAIEDRRAGQSGRFDGDAAFTPDGPALNYRESGLLRLGAHQGQAFQHYLYRFPEPRRAEVAFPDGRAFHALDLTSGSWQAVHRCGGDLYRADFRVEGADAWRVVWTVTGPRKTYVSTNRYERFGRDDRKNFCTSAPAHVSMDA